VGAIQATPGCISINLDTQGRMAVVGREAMARPVQPKAAESVVEVSVAAADRLRELVNSRLSFGYDEESDRVYVQVIDTDTGEVVRQIPPERMLEMLAQVREMIGLILDEKA